jgi:hypothetical protein
VVNFMATRLRVVHQSACPEIGPICEVRREPPHLHDQVLWVSEVRGLIDYGLSDEWGLELQVPVRWTYTTIEYQTLDGAVFVPDYETIHHRNETLFGLGDPWLRLRRSWRVQGALLSFKGGLSIPIGRTEPDPFALGEAGRVHQHLQFGTGTFDPVLGLDLSLPFGRLQLDAYAQTQLVVYANQHQYQAGHRAAVGLQVGLRFLEDGLAFGTIDAIHEEAERWSGVVQQDGNLGRTDLLLGAGLGYRFGFGLLSASLKTPVYQRIIQVGDEPGQLTYPWLLNLSVRR